MPRNEFKPKYDGKMPNQWQKPVYLLKSNVKCHDEAVGIWGEMERDEVKKLRDLINEWVNGIEKPRLKIASLTAIKPIGGRCGLSVELGQRAEFPSLYSRAIDNIFPGVIWDSQFSHT